MKSDPHPWKPVAVEMADTVAIQALASGNADADQQRRALSWIIHNACAAYDQSYRPGVDGDRNTAFAEGRRFVGLAIIKETRINVAGLRRSENV